MPLVLALVMGGLIAVAASGAQRGVASAIPAPAQYTTPTSNNNPFSNPLVVAGVALGILVIVFALLLAFRMRGRGMSGSEEDGGSAEGGASDEEGSSGTGDEPYDASSSEGGHADDSEGAPHGGNDESSAGDSVA